MNRPTGEGRGKWEEVMRSITLQELKDIKKFGLSYYIPDWKEKMIREFANMESPVYCLNDAIDYIIDRITKGA
jgi:hypothetical protein